MTTNISIEKVVKPINSSFSAITYKHDFFEAPLHIHPEFELILIEKGEGHSFIGDMVYKLKPGDFILLGPNLPHLWLSADEYYIKENKLYSASVYSHFNKNIFPDDAREIKEFSSILHLLHEAEKGVRFSDYNSEKIKSAFRALPSLTGFSKLMSLYQILYLLSNCQYTHLTSPNYANTYESYNDDKIIHDSNIFMNRNYQENITLKQIADYVGMNPSSLCRYYKKNTGNTLFQYLATLRISFATKLLVNKNLSISQIAYDCGYNNLSLFNRQFKKLIGKTPSEYYEEIHKYNLF